MRRAPIDVHAIVAAYCLILALHALGASLPIAYEPDYVIAGAFAAIAGLFGLVSCQRAIQRSVARFADEE